MVGTTISHYLILEKAGAGGMGVVYKAQDTRLGRFVALKFLPDEFAYDPQIRDRFQREARAASALNHPNICTVYDIGEADGRIFMAMEFLEGVTLKDLISNGPLDVHRLVDIGVQVLDGLDAAHAESIVHRDIKPANIFVTSKGLIKILDFGLAKMAPASKARLVAAGNDSCESDGGYVTTGGGALGTMPYMSPEQALGKPLDTRSDLFSFGITLYEMATGQMAFEGETTGMLFLSIVQGAPVPVTDRSPAAPPELRSIIERCLEKDPVRRYQHARDIRDDLKQVATVAHSAWSSAAAAPAYTGQTIPQRRGAISPDSAPSAPPANAGVVTRVPDRRSRRIWLTLATVLLVLAIGGGLYWRSHKKLVLTSRDTIVLGDISNSTGDPVFDDPLKMALMVGLRQSPFLNVLSENRVASTLRLMTLPAQTKLTPDVAGEICQRTDSQAYIAASIASLGSEYVLGLKAVNCKNGELLAQELETAPGKEKVLDALGQATTNLRTHLGESLTTVQSFDVPLEEATTPSLEALGALTQGRQAQLTDGDSASIPYFKRAVELDPNFALAYATLGTAYANLRESDLAKENYQKAYDLRTRASAREQFALTAFYYNDVTGDLEKANQTYQLYARAYPREWVTHNNLGANYAALGQWANALSEVREAVRLNPDSGVAYGNLVEYYCRLERFAEAKETYQQAEMRGLEYPDLHYYRYGVAFLEGDTAEMRRQAEWAAGKPGREDVLLSTESDSAAFAGRLAAARELSQRAADSARHSGENETAARRQLNEAIREAEFGYPAEARSLATAALRLSSTRSTRVLAAMVFARAGDSAAAVKLVDELHKQNPESTKLNVYWLPSIRAAIELSRQNPNGAIEALAAAVPYELGTAGPQPELGALFYPIYLRGSAYLALHQGAAAVAEFEKYRQHRGIAINSVSAGLAPLGLARAYAMRGDVKASRAVYELFLHAWQGADPETPAFKEARAEYARLN
jgi:serine/threonine protein kinase/tetratricopeptide (TPR) repeat protein